MDRNAMVWIDRRRRGDRRHSPRRVRRAQRASPRRSRRLRSEIGQRTEHLEKREAVATETEAKARAAQAEAEVKAAEAARLQNTARTHREAVTTTREELDAHRERVDKLDPKRSTDEPDPGKADDVRADASAADQRHSRDHLRS